MNMIPLTKDVNMIYHQLELSYLKMTLISANFEIDLQKKKPY